MNLAQLGMTALALSALLGIGAGAVGLFVLRVEFVQERREREALAERVQALEGELAGR